MKEKISRKDIVAIISDKMGFSKKEAWHILNTLIELLLISFEETTKDLKSSPDDEKIAIEFRGFGTFKIKKRKPRKANVPGKDRTFKLSERFHLKFKPVKSLIKELQQ